ncbi:MAG: acylneuraminate cytidylyltransferase family protein [Pseudoxanthomonas sp.]
MKLATICARGGSAGVPGKNIRPLLGKPLIAWTIEQALASGIFDRVCVSTDSAEIAGVAVAAGAEVPFVRPAGLATATAAKLPVIRHLVEWIEANSGPVDRVIDLDPTSPLRDVADIRACNDLLDEGAELVITGYESDKNPYFNMVEHKADGSVGRVCVPAGNVVARQLAPKVYAMNASIYAWRRSCLTDSLWLVPGLRLHVMPRERSIDIDHPIDFDLVELLMKQRIRL